MKKTILVLIVSAFAFASCSQYTCPTYSKAAPKTPTTKQTRI